MTNPTTIDRRDVAHPTNPVGGHTQIEQEDLGMPPARSGQSSAGQEPAEIRGETSGSGGANRVGPKSRIPEPVKQNLGFRRTFNEGER